MMNRRVNNSLAYFALCLFMAVFITSCGVYSFTGASISPDVTSVTVGEFPNTSTGGPPGLSQTVSEALKDKLISETTLNLERSNGDIEFRGAITGYTVLAQAAVAGQTTALNRLTITMQVEYINRVNEKAEWTQSFSRYADFPSATSLSSVEDQLVETITSQLVDDIFNKALVNW